MVYLFHVLNTGNDNMVFLFLYVDQVVRVIVIQKTLNMLRSFAKLKQFLKRQRTFWNGAWRKFLRDTQEGSTETAEVGW
ncbi:hypothetical protein Bca4012_076722 [Brassica carinata]